MISVLEYMYSRIYNMYTRWGEKDVPGIYSICILSLLQTLNVLSIVILMIKIKLFPFDWLKIHYALWLFLTFSLANYWYIYRIKGKYKILQKYNDSKAFTRIKKQSNFYIIFTTAFFLIIFIHFFLQL